MFYMRFIVKAVAQFVRKRERQRERERERERGRERESLEGGASKGAAVYVMSRVCVGGLEFFCVACLNFLYEVWSN